MGGNNGNVRTFGDRLQQMAAKARQDVPIVGQPFVLEGWFLQLLLTCRCEHPKPVLILGQPGAAAGQCASCHTVYTLISLGLNPQGQPSFNVAMSAAPPTAPEPAPGEAEKERTDG
jgi:hypothetical protein